MSISREDCAWSRAAFPLLAVQLKLHSPGAESIRLIPEGCLLSAGIASLQPSTMPASHPWNVSARNTEISASKPQPVLLYPRWDIPSPDQQPDWRHLSNSESTSGLLSIPLTKSSVNPMGRKINFKNKLIIILTCWEYSKQFWHFLGAVRYPCFPFGCTSAIIRCWVLPSANTNSSGDTADCVWCAYLRIWWVNSVLNLYNCDRSAY